MHSVIFAHNLKPSAMKELMNAAGRSGSLLGLVGVILLLISYLFMEAIYTSFMLMSSWGILVLIVTFAIALIFGFRWRKSVGGYASYKDAFTFMFLMLLLSGVINLAMEVVLYHVIEPDFQKQTMTMIIETTEEFMYDMGTPQSQIDETIDQMEEGNVNLSVMERIGTFKWRPIIYLLMALFLALFVKKEKPIFE